MTKNIIIIFSFLTLIFTACSAVPTTRYETNPDKEIIKEEEKEEPKKLKTNDIKNILIEDYDVKRFNPDLSIKKDNEKYEIKTDKEIWYSFPEKTESNSSNTPKIISTSEGFRVFVFLSDNLEELNEVQSRLEQVKGIHRIYSIFEPPFYKLYIGDFTVIEEANSLRRKLLQLDFKESKVIRTTINIFQ